MTIMSPVTADAYDAAGRLIATTEDPHPDGETGHLNIVAADADDAADHLASVINPCGDSKLFGYDDANRRTGVTLPTGGIYAMTYDAVGSLTAITDPNAHVVTHGCDAANRRTSAANALSQATSYGYDAANRRTSLTDPLAETTNFLYDGTLRTIGVTHYATDNPFTLTDPSGPNAFGTSFPTGAGVDLGAVIPPLLAWFEATALIELPFVGFLIVLIVLVIILALVALDLTRWHFGERAAAASAQGAGDVLNRLFNGAGAVELPGQVKDKLGRVLGDALGRAAALIVIGAKITVKVTGEELAANPADEPPLTLFSHTNPDRVHAVRVRVRAVHELTSVFVLDGGGAVGET